LTDFEIGENHRIADRHAGKEILVAGRAEEVNSL
jgi:hypothetical protein